ncbi:MAG: DUF6291 domain-containing protein, partial [Coprobacillus sp.]|nr:DUF6291 domain-containing protein [Coprobacillus sp.]
MAKTKDIRVLCNCEWRHNLSVLPPEIRAKIYDAIFEYAETGEATGLEVMEIAIFEPIRKEVERYMESYRLMCERKKERALEREENKRIQQSTTDHNSAQQSTTDHN